jgi:hypothetical protein
MSGSTASSRGLRYTLSRPKEGHERAGDTSKYPRLFTPSASRGVPAARAGGQSLRGATVAPPWWQSVLSARGSRKILLTHLHTSAGRYLQVLVLHKLRNVGSGLGNALML